MVASAAVYPIPAIEGNSKSEILLRCELKCLDLDIQKGKERKGESLRKYYFRNIVATCHTMHNNCHLLRYEMQARFFSSSNLEFQLCTCVCSEWLRLVEKKMILVVKCSLIHHPFHRMNMAMMLIDVLNSSHCCYYYCYRY